MGGTIVAWLKKGKWNEVNILKTYLYLIYIQSVNYMQNIQSLSMPNMYILHITQQHMCK